jgi:hypothetical protein
MTVSRAERLRTAAAAEQDGKIRSDTSEIVHSFDDGWTVNRLATCGDVRREGFLMNSCVPKYVGDVLISRAKPARYQPGERGDEDTVEPVGFDLLRTTDLSGANYGQRLHSLRDPMNLPHLTFWASKAGAWDIFGHKNAKPKVKYLKRLGQWAEAANIRHVEGLTERADLHKCFEDGLFTYEGSRLSSLERTLTRRILGEDAKRGTKLDDPKLERYRLRMWKITWRNTMMIATMHELSTANREDRAWLKWMGESATERDRMIITRNSKVRRCGIRIRRVKLHRAMAEMQEATDALLAPTQRQWYAGRRRKGGPIMNQSADRLRKSRRGKKR